MATYTVIGVNQGLGYGNPLSVVTSTFDNSATVIATTDFIFAYNPGNAVQTLQLVEAMESFKQVLLNGPNLSVLTTDNVII